MNMKLLKKVWRCGPYARAMVVGYVAAPIIAACAISAPVLLVLGKITPSTYQHIGQSFIYAALAFGALGSLCFLEALRRRELHNLSG